jgi:hypothetical protein
MVGITKVQRAKPGPKSVSLIYALGDEEVRERTVGAYDSAVAAGMHYLEQEPALSSGKGRQGDRARAGSCRNGLSPWREPGRRPRPSHPQRIRP